MGRRDDHECLTSISGTPTILIDGKAFEGDPYAGPLEKEALKAAEKG